MKLTDVTRNEHTNTFCSEWALEGHILVSKKITTESHNHGQSAGGGAVATPCTQGVASREAGGAGGGDAAAALEGAVRRRFDDVRQRETRDDIWLSTADRPAYGSAVEVHVAEGWCRARLVELVWGSDQWVVAFDDGGWADDVILGDADLRYAFAGGGAGLGEKRGKGVGAGDGVSEGSMKRGGDNRRDEAGVRQPDSGASSAVENDLHEVRSRTRFSTTSNRAVQMRTHSGEKPYVCETLAFSESGSLARHMRAFARPGTCRPAA